MHDITSITKINHIYAALLGKLIWLIRHEWNFVVRFLLDYTLNEIDLCLLTKMSKNICCICFDLMCAPKMSDISAQLSRKVYMLEWVTFWFQYICWSTWCHSYYLFICYVKQNCLNDEIWKRLCLFNILVKTLLN